VCSLCNHYSMQIAELQMAVETDKRIKIIRYIDTE